MQNAITRLTVVAAAAAAALLLVAAILLSGNMAPSGASHRSSTVRPAAPATQTLASASRFSPLGRRWV